MVDLSSYEVNQWYNEYQGCIRIPLEVKYEELMWTDEI